jgi:ABC-type uncharacterized transport system fused permease/ATPase subunit
MRVCMHLCMYARMSVCLSVCLSVCVYMYVCGLHLVLLPNHHNHNHDHHQHYYHTLSSFSLVSFIDLTSIHVHQVLSLRNNIHELSGFTERIIELLDFLSKESRDLQSSSITEQFSAVLLLNKITVTPPEEPSRLLVKDLTMSVPQGTSVLVVGPNGCGKTSLFRVIAGLWRAQSGTISKPKTDPSRFCEIMLLPQKAYLCLGTLRDQVLYPMRLSPSETTDEIDRRVLEALCAAGLARLVIGPSRAFSHGLHQSFEEWEEVLSGGERQRIGFARLFFHRPVFACLDEATSAVNPEDEGKLYEHLLSLNVTVFSIAHRPSLRKFHAAELCLSGDGTGQWELKPLRANP